jgi:hypothetical protein
MNDINGLWLMVVILLGGTSYFPCFSYLNSNTHFWIVYIIEIF